MGTGMDAASRQWYLQQMGIPVWLPKGHADLTVGEAVEHNRAVESAAVAAEPSSTIQPATTVPTSTAAAGPSPAKLRAESLRANNAIDAAAGNDAVSIWLVMPFLEESQRAEADALIDKVLAAVDVKVERCLRLWAVPNTLPPAQIKYLWCFGIQPPPNSPAQALLLPSVADMLGNVDAKRAAWQQLKAAMPFN